MGLVKFIILSIINPNKKFVSVDMKITIYWTPCSI